MNGLVAVCIPAIIGWFIWKKGTFKDAYHCISQGADYENLSREDAIEKYIKEKNFSGYKANYLREKLNKELASDAKEADKEKNNEDDLIKIAKFLIEIAQKTTTICFSDLYIQVLKKEWRWRVSTKCIGKILDIIGRCCKKNDFPFINGLVIEKGSYKINRGFWQSSWETLLPIKSYEEQTEENVKKFQQDIYKKIEKMTPEEIDKFLEKLKTFESTYKD